MYGGIDLTYILKKLQEIKNTRKILCFQDLTLKMIFERPTAACVSEKKFSWQNNFSCCCARVYIIWSHIKVILQQIYINLYVINRSTDYGIIIFV